MTTRPPLRVALSSNAVSVWSHELFGTADSAGARSFLARTFMVGEVERVELCRSESSGRIIYGAATNPAQIWRKLSKVLGAAEPAGSDAGETTGQRIDAGHLYLDGPRTAPVRVTRIGGALSTWRVRHLSESKLSVWHPALLNRRELVFRLEEELASMFGVEAYRASALSGGASIRFDTTATTAERVARELEKAWPRLLGGFDGPPSSKRLVVSIGLVGFAYYGQYVAPAVRPFAVAGMALYSLPNLVNAAKDLRHGRLGLPALYSTGLAFMLISGFPFTASVMAALMQAWPHLARRKLVRTQRRIFAAQRRRPAWARRLTADGSDLDISVDDLSRDDLIVVRRGETIPVDGFVASGSAAITAAPFKRDDVEDKLPGDAVSAGAFVRDGSLTIRVERSGRETSANHIDSLLPRAWFPALPSSREAERVANRNAKPALAAAAIAFGLTHTLPLSQALIRPDYATGLRISAQLSTLRGIAEAWQDGVLFRDPTALDRLANVDVYVIDDTAGVERRSLEVAEIRTANGTRAELVVDYVRRAHVGGRGDRARALAAFPSTRASGERAMSSIERRSSVVRYKDSAGHEIEIAAPQYLVASKIEVPSALRAPRRSSRTRLAKAESGALDPSLAPLWVLCDGRLIGTVSFARATELVGRPVVAALAAQNPKARIVYLSQGGRQATRAVADGLGVELFYGGLSPAEKLSLIRSLDGRVLWIGDGSDPRARETLAASSVSVSVAPLWSSRGDVADIQLVNTDLASLPRLREYGHAHERRLARDYRAIHTANLLGAAGAVFGNLTALHTGLLSNVGTAFIYARHALALDALARSAEARRARLR